MKKQILTIMAAFILALSVPLLAQSTDQPTDQPTQQPAVEQNEPNVDSSAQAEVSIDNDATMSEEQATSDEEELPKTASPLALLLVVGAGAGASALGIRKTRRN